MPADKGKVNVFEYGDYRLCLEEWYKERKARDRKFSHRFIASQVRATSTGWFSDIVKGRTNLSDSHLAGVIRLMQLGKSEAAYFEALVRYDRAGSLEEKTLQYRKLVTMKGTNLELVGGDRFEFYSEWFHAVIRELLFFYEFTGDFQGLAKKLSPAITPAQARKSIRLLEALGFIGKTPGGRFKPAAATLKKDPAFRSLHLASFLKSFSRLGMEAVETVPKEERDVSCMTLSFSRQGFEKAKGELLALRNSLLQLTKDDENPDRVYQCNFQMFPVTR